MENEINGTDDKGNQLARYYEIAGKLNKEVTAIIYLPFYIKRPVLTKSTLFPFP